MKKILMLLALVFMIGCSPKGPRPSASHQDRGQIEFRLINRNWNSAKVYLTSANAGTIGTRIANVPTNSRVIVRRRVSHIFRIQVLFMASRDMWISETWQPFERCLELEIHQALIFSYVSPCR